ncbi:hypothetical protein [Kingella oralis]|uniref:hypothetical protein n=1 Tax=Kingella oralis TaxID=505 RepID=UPI0028E275D2|nr:hypothetical protein [Kingella oralis]
MSKSLRVSKNTASKPLGKRTMRLPSSSASVNRPSSNSTKQQFCINGSGSSLSSTRNGCRLICIPPQANSKTSIVSIPRQPENTFPFKLHPFSGYLSRKPTGSQHSVAELQS